MNFYNLTTSPDYTSYIQMNDFNGNVQSRIKVLWDMQYDINNKVINCGLLTTTND